MSKKFEETYRGCTTFHAEDYTAIVVPAYNHDDLQAAKAMTEYLGEHVTTQEVKIGYVRWHGGISFDGDMSNKWWLEGKESEHKKGANKVWYYSELEL